MGFPFTLKKASVAEYYWEKNDWYRKNGYSLPLNMYLFAQWVCLITFDLGFFCFLVNFLIEDTNDTRLGENELSIEYLQQTLSDAQVIQVDPFSTRSCIISFLPLLTYSIRSLVSIIYYLNVHLFIRDGRSQYDREDFKCVNFNHRNRRSDCNKSKRLSDTKPNLRSTLWNTSD